MSISLQDAGVFVSWQAPLSPNGVLEYSVTLQGADLARPGNLLPDLTTVTMETSHLFVTPTPPYTQFTATVVPITAAGMGEAGMDSLTTNQESKLSASFVVVVQKTRSVLELEAFFNMVH